MNAIRQTYHTTDSILNRVKSQHELGAMRPRLYQVTQDLRRKVTRPSYEWMYYAGMGDVDLRKIQPEEHKLVRELIKNGRLVPTFEDDFYGMKKIRLIQHFDDVKFGVDTKGKILIYDLIENLDVSDPVIRPDKKHDAAISLLKKRMGYDHLSHIAVIDPEPLQLRGGPVIRPIVTDSQAIKLQRRQAIFTP